MMHTTVLREEVHEMVEQLHDDEQLEQVKSVISGLLSESPDQSVRQLLAEINEGTDDDQSIRQLLAALDESSEDGRVLTAHQVLRIYQYLKREADAQLRAGTDPMAHEGFSLTPEQHNRLLLSIAESYSADNFVSQKEAHQMFAQWSER